ncbi:hypothetical protein QCA50_006261 [Cerrena zonata]|uniref:Uncharacterized protein n=1 Tax=Cerrena zonata TaxID=2478898 RepID=A0AAW0GLS2_9APHY
MSEIIERSASFPAFPRYSIEYDWASIYLSAGNEDSLAADTGHFQQPRQHAPLEITINISPHQLPTSVGGITSRLNLTCVRQLHLDILRICRPIEDFMFLPSITVLRLAVKNPSRWPKTF